METNDSIQRIDAKIQALKERLLGLAPMHPGSVSEQYHVCGQPGCHCKDPAHPQRHGPYSKLRYVHRGQQVCRFVRPQWVTELKAQLAVYKQFRQLADEWVGLSIQRAQLTFFAASPKPSSAKRPSIPRKSPPPIKVNQQS
jgi:hypothetical protein